MKPSKGIERGATAWNRWVSIYRSQPLGEFEDHLVPVRLRGYSEVAMSDLTPKERKAIDTSIRRGYTLVKSSRWYKVLHTLLLTVDWNLGYLGKTRGQLWFPSTEIRDACHKHMEAQLVMTDKFAARGLTKYGDDKIYVSVPTDRYSSDHLKAHLTELRQVVDEHMKDWEAERLRFADRLLPDTAVVRVPFDTKKDEDND